MTQILFTIVACAILLLASTAAYQYITHRVEGKCQIKEFLHIRYAFIPLLVMLIAFFASAFVFLFGYLGNNEPFLRALMNADVMLWLSVLGYIDARERIIPNCLIGIGLLFWLVLILLEIFVGGTPWLQLLVFSGIGGIACGGLLFVIALIVKSALGMGDVKMFFVLGLLYGLTDAYGILLFSIIAMGVVSIALLIAKKVTAKSTIPMAPFVILGFFLSIIAGM